MTIEEQVEHELDDSEQEIAQDVEVEVEDDAETAKTETDDEDAAFITNAVKTATSRPGFLFSFVV